MLEIKSRVEAMNIFQLRELATHVNGRITALAGPASVPPLTGFRPGLPARLAFKHGDLIEFTAKGGLTIRAVVDRLNDKTIGCHETDSTRRKWRVSYGLARLVGADKPALPSAPVAPAFVSHAPSLGAAPSAGGGSW